jgi:hypothetical protein
MRKCYTCKSEEIVKVFDKDYCVNDCANDFKIYYNWGISHSLIMSGLIFGYKEGCGYLVTTDLVTLKKNKRGNITKCRLLYEHIDRVDQSENAWWKKEGFKDMTSGVIEVLEQNDE